VYVSNTGEIMEPRLNIKVAELFEKTAAPVQQDPNFIPPGVQWNGDYMDQNSNHFQQNYQAYDEQRQGLGAQIQRYVDESHIHATDENPAQDPVLMAANPALVGSPDLSNVPSIPAGAKPQLTHAASKLAAQSFGFNNAQVNPDCTLGVVASASANSLVSARVVAETPSTKIAGTIIAVGDQEFAVVWDDKTASVERKNDYELVVTQ
jgi:hypothetical protein